MAVNKLTKISLGILAIFLIHVILAHLNTASLILTAMSRFNEDEVINIKNV
jgi:hypothetical protein